MIDLTWLTECYDFLSDFVGQLRLIDSRGLGGFVCWLSELYVDPSYDGMEGRLDGTLMEPSYGD